MPGSTAGAEESTRRTVTSHDQRHRRKTRSLGPILLYSEGTCLSLRRRRHGCPELRGPVGRPSSYRWLATAARGASYRLLLVSGGDGVPRPLAVGGVGSAFDAVADGQDCQAQKDVGACLTEGCPFSPKIGHGCPVSAGVRVATEPRCGLRGHDPMPVFGVA